MLGRKSVARFEGDSGLQPERTALAWIRSVLASTLGCLIATFTAVRLGHYFIAGLGSLFSLVTLGIALIPWRRLAPKGAASPWWSLVNLVILAVLPSGLGVALTMVALLHR